MNALELRMSATDEEIGSWLAGADAPRRLKFLGRERVQVEPFEYRHDGKANVAKYSEDQPRVPAGSPEGGQWTDGGGDGGAQSSGDKPDMSTIRPATNYRSGVERGAAVPPDKQGSTWTPERGGTLLHGAQIAFNNNWKTDVAYLTDDFEEAKQYALGVHFGGSGGKYPMVQRFEGLAGKTLDIDHYLAKAMSEDWDPGEALDIAFDHARSRGARYVTYEHPSNIYGDKMQRVVVSLYPKEDLRFETLWRVSRRKPKALTKILLQDVPVLADLAARLEPMLRKRFEAVIKQIKGTIDGEMLVELANAIGSGNISRAEALLKMGEWPEKFGGMATDLRAGFIVGTRVGMTALSNVNVSLDFKLVDSHTVEYARRRLPPLVQSIKDGAREMVRQTMTESVQGKWTPFEAAEGIRDWIGLTAQQASASAKFERDLIDRGIPPEKIADRVAKYEDALLRQRAETIARTEIQYAANAGQVETWQEATRQGLLSKGTKKVWLTANDERLCPVCENLGNAEPVGLNEQFVYDDGTKAETVFGEPLHAPPQHPNCFPAGTFMSGRFIAGSKAWYSGKMIRLSTRQGHSLTVTANHPILTREGWKPAHSLREGENVLGQNFAGIRSMLLGAVNDEQPPAMIQDVFESLRPHGFATIEISGLDFHGDAQGMDRHVEIVGPTVGLMFGRQSIGNQDIHESTFMRSNVQQSLRGGFGPGNLGGHRHSAPTGGCPSSSALTLNERPICLDTFPFHEFSFGLGAHPDLQLAKPSIERDAAYANFFLELQERSSGQIAVDEIVDVLNFDFSGHVYDLQSETGWILSQNIVTSNCRCTTILELE